jgi:hypothetical protein
MARLRERRQPVGEGEQVEPATLRSLSEWSDVRASRRISESREPKISIRFGPVADLSHEWNSPIARAGVRRVRRRRRRSHVEVEEEGRLTCESESWLALVGSVSRCSAVHVRIAAGSLLRASSLWSACESTSRARVRLPQLRAGHAKARFQLPADRCPQAGHRNCHCDGHPFGQPWQQIF